MSDLLQRYGVLFVFGLVLVEQLGLPVPAYPVLIVAGALGATGAISWALALFVAVLACLLSDYFWFRAGQIYGKRVLRLLCRISLNPDSCVSQTEDNFLRWGERSLVVAKFVPGFNTVAPPLAGAMGTTTPRFLAYTVAGALVWSGSGLALGALFHTRVDSVLGALATLGSTALIVVGGLLGLFILYKYLERRRFRRALAVERIAVAELVALMAAGHDPLIVDARSATAHRLEPAIPGALALHAVDRAALMASLDRDRYVIVYCSCPNDVTAAEVAKQFLAHGFHRARPLQGGLDAWKAHQHGAPAPARFA
jgi:membrane protein DedA with SNARE-associated domain/rhodanese-related sulfurtransferase